MKQPADEGGDERVEALVFETLERMEKEGTAAIESAVSDHPELGDELRSRLGALLALGLVGSPSGSSTSSAMPVATQPVTVPARVGPYQMGASLGEGGMGLVFEAFDPILRRQVAVKLIRPQYLARTSLRERFQREGQAVARLQHPAVARVFQVGEEAGQPYMAMERVFGCTLSAVLDQVKSASSQRLTGEDFFRTVQEFGGAPTFNVRGGLFDGTWAEVAVRVCRDAAEGLAHAHAAGVLHRDIKASNIMVTSEGRVLLIDFGLAQLDTAATMTATGGRIGSLPYTAPERVTSSGTPSERSDVYSLGVVLYELLALQLPFRAASEAALVRMISAADPEPVQRRCPGLSAPMVESLQRAMRRDPVRRTPSAAAFGHDLTRALAGQPPLPHGDGLLSALASRWRAQPFMTSAAIAAILLSLALPTVVLAVRTRAAERTAQSDQRSLQRLQLALDATESLKDAMPRSAIIAGTPLEDLRAGVLKGVADLQRQVTSDWPEGAELPWPHGAAGPRERDRQLIDEATEVVERGHGDPARRQRAVALVGELRGVRAASTRSLDVSAALIELLEWLAKETETPTRYAKEALELTRNLQMALPESTWLEARESALVQLVGASASTAPGEGAR